MEYCMEEDYYSPSKKIISSLRLKSPSDLKHLKKHLSDEPTTKQDRLPCSCNTLDDIIAVKKLPEQVISVSDESKILKNYLRECEEKYNEAYEAFLNEIEVVNHSIDEDVRTHAVTLKQYLDTSEHKVTTALNNEPIFVTYEEKLEMIKNVCLKNVDEILSYKENVSELEGKRCTGIKSVLRENFHKLVDTGYKSTSVLLDEMSEKIRKGNYQIVMNYRVQYEVCLMLLKYVERCYRSQLSKLKSKFTEFVSLVKKFDDARASGNYEAANALEKLCTNPSSESRFIPPRALHQSPDESVQEFFSPNSFTSDPATYFKPRSRTRKRENRLNINTKAEQKTSLKSLTLHKDLNRGLYRRLSTKTKLIENDKRYSTDDSMYKPYESHSRETIITRKSTYDVEPSRVRIRGNIQSRFNRDLTNNSKVAIQQKRVPLSELLNLY